MALPTDRFPQLQRLQSWVCFAAAVGGLALIAMGTLGYGGALKLWIIVAGGFVLFLALMLMTIAPLAVMIEARLAQQYEELRGLRRDLQAQNVRLDAIVENTHISDAAKSVAHREQELAALRAAIHDNVERARWEAAFGLVHEMERRFGFGEEARRFRAEVEEARLGAIEVKLEEALALVESHFAAHDWDRARSEMDRLNQLFPDNVQVQGLFTRIDELRAAHKEALKKNWQVAVERNDTDHAIDVLKELDSYLTSEEGQALRDQARHVFKDKLLQLGVQFRFAVQEKRWQDALDTGLELVREFPNARMASEVRDTLDVLRQRARSTA